MKETSGVGPRLNDDLWHLSRFIGYEEWERILESSGRMWRANDRKSGTQVVNDLRLHARTLRPMRHAKSAVGQDAAERTDEAGIGHSDDVVALSREVCRTTPDQYDTSGRDSPPHLRMHEADEFFGGPAVGLVEEIADVGQNQFGEIRPLRAGG